MDEFQRHYTGEFVGYDPTFTKLIEAWKAYYAATELFDGVVFSQRHGGRPKASSLEEETASRQFAAAMAQRFLAHRVGHATKADRLRARDIALGEHEMEFGISLPFGDELMMEIARGER